MLLKVSEEFKVKFAEEMYANDKSYPDFVDGDIVRAYYFGYLLPAVCKDLEEDGFKITSPEEQVMGIKWNIRKHRPQMNFWNTDYLKKHGSSVNLVNLDSYILEKMVVDHSDLLEIATVLGLRAARLIEKALQEEEKEDGKV